MALFTDSDIVTLQDLLPFEASLVQIASSHGINVETKINLSIAAAGDKLLFWLLRAGMSDPQWVSRRLLGLSTVVVTPTLHRWLCFDTLSRFYSEAYYVQLNTRFEGKWTEYQAAADEAFTMVANAGIGIVYNPTTIAISLRAEWQSSGAGPVYTNGMGGPERKRRRPQPREWVDFSGRKQCCGADGRRGERPPERDGLEYLRERNWK